MERQIHDNLLHLIRNYLQDNPLNDSPFLIQTRKKAYPMFIQRIIKKYLILKTTNNQTNPHILKHTFVTHLLNNRADLKAIKELLGYFNLASTQGYHP